MAPRTPEQKPQRRERDTLHRQRFFSAYDRKSPTTSFNSLCKSHDIDIPPSTGRLWLRQREIRGSPAMRRTRRTSKELGRKKRVSEADMDAVLDPNNPTHWKPYNQQVEDLGLDCHPHTLQQNLSKRKNARRYKMYPTSYISPANKARRTEYGEKHQGKSLMSWWQYIYFTDEVHFNSKEMSFKPTRELRQRGQRPTRPINEAPAPTLDVTVHVAAGISYNHKGPLIFYHDPPEAGARSYGTRRPRRSSVQTPEDYREVLQAWNTQMELQGLIEPRGNSMTGDEYASMVLPHHIAHIKWLQAKYKRAFFFQEDGDPSHGRKNPDSAPARLKSSSDLKLLIHPPQSPDLNPIEAVWQIIKQRLRGGSWKTVAEFKEAIEREWRHVTVAQIRRRIREMPQRCAAMVNTKGKRYRSDLW